MSRYYSSSFAGPLMMCAAYSDGAAGYHHRYWQYSGSKSRVSKLPLGSTQCDTVDVANNAGMQILVLQRNCCMTHVEDLIHG